MKTLEELTQSELKKVTMAPDADFTGSMFLLDWMVGDNGFKTFPPSNLPVDASLSAWKNSPVLCPV
jgi:hypothetical protein